MQRSKSLPYLLPITIAFCPIVTASNTQAQIIPDNTLGNESSQVNSPDSNTQQIDGGAIRGDNLFHSFQEFNVNEGNTVNFSNPQGINHIFSRVTGNNPSNILGTLSVIGNADLFFLNPNGIIFGSNASLNINGSFLATSASTIHFADGNQFTTTNVTDKPLLTIARPIGLTFEEPPGAIVNRSVALNSQGFSEGLTVNSGKTLALVGGDILFEAGFVNAFGGRIELASAAVDDFIGLSQINDQWILDYKGLKQGKTIRLTNGLNPNFNNFLSDSFIFAVSENGDLADITISGKDIILDDVQITMLSFDDTSTGNLVVNALDTIELRNNRFNENEQFPLRSILGIVAINEIDNKGEVIIDTKNLIIDRGGAINVSAGISKNTETGEILGFLQGGNIKINASELVEVKNGGAIQTTSATFNNAGNTNITSPKIIVSNGGKITAEATSTTISGTEQIITGTGDGGTVTLVSDSIEVIDGGIISSSTIDEGNAGSINITTQDLTLRNGGNITVESRGTGKAGGINLQAQSLFLDNNSYLAAATTQSDGGNIDLVVKDNITLENQSNISASVGGDGNGGNITIDTDFLIANPQENTDITANAERGNGGSISITALEIIGIQFREQLTEFSDITVTSEFGLNGTVEINNLDASIIQGLVDSLPDILDTNNIFENNYCKITRGDKYVVTGRGGLPLTPERDIAPQYIWEDWRISNQDNLNNNTAISNNKTSIAAATNRDESRKLNPIQGWSVDQKGRIVLTANPIMVTPHAAMNHNLGCS
ncbi:MAG: filamentous hemagglutinin N-terminal domain-containing protein [Xenococcaceae cyanobacterium MO_188.B19]|nr:filamentous hemagglutinin N-terminal domain-containing protein [Xenococcaceae cyanobacterium MO_188.B19]